MGCSACIDEKEYFKCVILAFSKSKAAAYIFLRWRHYLPFHQSHLYPKYIIVFNENEWERLIRWVWKSVPNVWIQINQKVVKPKRKEKLHVLKCTAWQLPTLLKYKQSQKQLKAIWNQARNEQRGKKSVPKWTFPSVLTGNHQWRSTG